MSHSAPARTSSRPSVVNILTSGFNRPSTGAGALNMCPGGHATPRYPLTHPAPPSAPLARRPLHKEREQTGHDVPTTHRHAHPIATDTIARALAHGTAAQASKQPMHSKRPGTRATRQPQQPTRHPKSPTSSAQVSHTALRAAHAHSKLHRGRQPGALLLADHLREHERGRTL